MQSTKPNKPFDLDNVSARRIVARHANSVYVWDCRPEITHIDLISEPEFASSNVKRLSDVLDDASFAKTPRWFLVANVDCFDPPVYLIRADNESEALDIFATEVEESVKISESDLPDYGDNYSVNDNGTPVDLESVSCWEVRESVRIEC